MEPVGRLVDPEVARRTDARAEHRPHERGGTVAGEGPALQRQVVDLGHEGVEHVLGRSTMGVGVPYAMGIKLAKPDSEVFCITGEGSVQMNIQELSTCLQYNPPIKICALNNRYLGMVRQWQEIEYSGRYSHSYMDALPNFVKLAEAYGHVGMLIERPQDVEPALREARKLKDRTVFMDFRTDPTENVFPMIQAGKGLTEMLLGSEDL